MVYAGRQRPALPEQYVVFVTFLAEKLQCYCAVLAYFSYILYKTTRQNK